MGPQLTLRRMVRAGLDLWPCLSPRQGYSLGEQKGDTNKEADVQSYPFLSVLWTLIVIFAWVIWFWMLIVIFGDLFRRDDISGWAKAIWVIFLIVLPFLGVLIYLVRQSSGMAARHAKQAQAAQAQQAKPGASSSPASEIENARHLLDNGSITREEFEVIKRKVIASS
jgi:uncharacterized membrane protein YcjF (UPF0283 family)